LFIPALLVLVAWALWRTVVKRDLAVGLAFYIGLVVVVDGFFNTGIYLPGLEKGSIRYSEVCACFLLLACMPARPRTDSPSKIYWLLWIYFSLMFTSALRSSPMMAGVMEFRALIIPQIVACLVARRGLASAADYRRFFATLATLAIIVGLFNVYDLFFDRWLLKSSQLDRPIYAHNRELNRLGSLFLNPNYLGAFVVMMFPVSFVWTLNERRRWARALGGITLLLLLFSLVQTQSRAPLLAFAVGLSLLLVGPCGAVSRGRRFGFLAVFVIVFTLMMPGFYQHAVGRFDDLNQETSSDLALSRQTTWIYTLRIIGEHPIAGIGFGEAQFMRVMSDMGFEMDFGVRSLDAPHNSYLQAAVYAGVPALIALVLANAILLAKAFGALRRFSGDGNEVLFGLAVAVTGFLLSIFPDLQLFTPGTAVIYWIFFGMLLSLTSSHQADAVPIPAPVPAFRRPPVQAAPRLAHNQARRLVPRRADTDSWR
jgi:O-antigen ligase